MNWNYALKTTQGIWQGIWATVIAIITWLAIIYVIWVSADNVGQLECGPMPNVMVTLPIIGGALCSMPQSLADAHY